MVAQISLLVAVLSLIATFIAPRFISGARIFAEAADASRLDTDQPTDRVKVRVFHDEEVIAEAVYVVTLFIENTGGKDVTSAEFIEPVKVSFGIDLEILSAALSGPDGVNASWTLAGGIGCIEWSILKPGEMITARVVARAISTAVRPDAILKAAKLVVRLRDVKVGRGWKRFTPALIAVMSGMIFAVMVGGALLLTILMPTNRWVYKDKAGHEFAVVERREDGLPNPSFAELSACPLRNKHYDANACIPLSPADARAYIGEAQRLRVGGSVSWTMLAILAAGAVVYGLLAIISLPVMRRFLRMSQKRNLGLALGLGRR